MLLLQSEFARYLSTLQEANIVYLAYSGGLDSTVLLHLCRDLPHVVLVHCNHKNTAAPQQDDLVASFCQIQAQVHQRQLIVHEATGPLVQEKACRNFRYRFLQSLAIQPNIIVLTAHHFHDQLETLCLKLLRGATPQSWLIAADQPFGQGRLLRPLLQVTRTAIAAYGVAQQLSYLPDPSNDDVQFRRNYLRHQVVQPLLAVQPHNVHQALALLTEQNELIQHYLDLLQAQVMLTPDTLALPPFRCLTPLIQRWLLRAILRHQGIRVSARFLQELCQKLLHLRRWHYHHLHYTFTIQDECLRIQIQQPREIFS